MSFAAVPPNSQLVLTDLNILLFFDILLDHFSVDANGAHKIPSRPDVKTPVFLAQLRKISPQIFRTLSLKYFHHMRWGVLRWHRHIHVNMIRSYGSFQDINIQPFTKLRENLFEPALDIFGLQYFDYLRTDPLFCRVVRLTRIPHRTKISTALKQSSAAERTFTPGK